ncbi:putative CoA-binding protein [Oxalobacteraceae bacterium GrIS 1.11]
MSDIARILADSRTIAVVGLSTKPERASFQVANYLQANGYRILPVNPAYAGATIFGERCHASLAEAAAAVAPLRIDIVDCFRKSGDILPIAQDAIEVGASCLWLQLDIVNREAAELAQAAGLDVVENRCLKIEHATRFAGG